MSKSYGNAIGLTDEPRDQFGKVMSVRDEATGPWLTLLTRLSEAEIAALLAGHPREAKARLAFELVAFLHGRSAADDARAAFDRQFRSGLVPDDVPEVAWPGDGDALPLAVLLRELGLAKSSSEARRLVAQGGVRLDGDVAQDAELSVARPTAALLIQVGKRRFARVRA
jgi:tyrosyl-tRNA synthetase